MLAAGSGRGGAGGRLHVRRFRVRCAHLARRCRMPRPITLFSGQWADLPLDTFCKKSRSFGYDGVELACWGDHFEVRKAMDGKAGASYLKKKWQTLEKHKLKCFAISAHLVGQA